MGWVPGAVRWGRSRCGRVGHSGVEWVMVGWVGHGEVGWVMVRWGGSW